MEQSAGSSGCFFLQNPATIISVFTFAYAYFVLRCGQKCMKDKQAYTLHTFARFYNIFQTVSNGLLAYHVLKQGLYQFLLPSCAVPDSSVPLFAQTNTIEWCILCSKFVDYIETVILLLEKRQHEITLLHVYRRVSAPWITWLTMKYFIVGSSPTFALLNCSVRAMTYTCYLLSSFESLQTLSNSARPLINIVEMAQLSISILYALQSFFLGCSVPVLGTSAILADLLINLVFVTL